MSFFKRFYLILVFFMLGYNFSSGQKNQNDSIDGMPSSKIKFAAYPAVGYAPETSLSFGGVGILIFRLPEKDPEAPFHRPSSISPYFLYTLRNQILSAIKSELYITPVINLNHTMRFFNYPDYYYGIGRDSDADRELYTDKFFRFSGDISWSATSRIFLGLRYDWQINQLSGFEQNSTLLRNGIIGTEGGHILGFGPLFRLDSRNDIYYPQKGIYLEFKNLLFPGTFGNDFVFNNLSLDFRTYNTVVSEKNILAFQFYYNQVSGERVPFYRLPRLGGDVRLRGIEHENRYRDKHAYYMQVEGRRELFWKLGGVVFGGIGNVAPSFSESGLREMKFVYGIGGRFRPLRDEKLNLRLDIGKGPGDQYAIYLSIKEAF